MGMRVALVLGPEEQSRGEVSVKNLKTGEQITVPQSQVAGTIADMLK
jgi:histidyl-tRNA synthetase